MIAPKNCSYCEKLLVQMPCLRCYGAGEVRKYLFFKETCPICGGKGSVKKCPDTYKHVWRDFQSPEKEVQFRRIVKPSYRVIIKNTPVTKADVTIRNLIRQGKILPPNNAKYPFRWQYQNPFHQQYLLEKQRKQHQKQLDFAQQKRRRSQFH